MDNPKSPFVIEMINEKKIIVKVPGTMDEYKNLICELLECMRSGDPFVAQSAYGDTVIVQPRNIACVLLHSEAYDTVLLHSEAHNATKKFQH